MCETKSVTSALYLDMNEGLTVQTELEDLKESRMKLNDGVASDKFTNKQKNLLEKYRTMSDEELDAAIAKGHDYHFIGKVGQFCPIKPGAGGGLLVREKDGKYYSATGAKGYRWMESDVVRTLHKEDDIDRSYYEAMCHDAMGAIGAYGDYTWFVSDDPYFPPDYMDGEYRKYPVYPDEMPFL